MLPLPMLLLLLPALLPLLLLLELLLPLLLLLLVLLPLPLPVCEDMPPAEEETFNWGQPVLLLPPLLLQLEEEDETKLPPLEKPANVDEDKVLLLLLLLPLPLPLLLLFWC